MMISPESFVSAHLTDSYEELIKERDMLIDEIRDFETNPKSEDEWMTDPSPEVIYQCNLEYLAKLCEYMAAKYNQETINGGDEDVF